MVAMGAPTFESTLPILYLHVHVNTHRSIPAAKPIQIDPRLQPVVYAGPTVPSGAVDVRESFIIRSIHA
jgi:hypothetical protein